MDIAPPDRHDWPVSDTPPPVPELKGYWLGFLTDQWEWESQVAADTLEPAKAAAREALLKLVEEETPKLACVTVLENGRKVGVWDWVERQPYWSWL